MATRAWVCVPWAPRSLGDEVRCWYLSGVSGVGCTACPSRAGAALGSESVRQRELLCRFALPRGGWGAWQPEEARGPQWSLCPWSAHRVGLKSCGGQDTIPEAQGAPDLCLGAPRGCHLGRLPTQSLGSRTQRGSVCSAGGRYLGGMNTFIFSWELKQNNQADSVILADFYSDSIFRH